eukprot:COSAG06_NODE_61323_length_268_cov_0.609467_1_plen_44_part_01
MDVVDAQFHTPEEATLTHALCFIRTGVVGLFARSGGSRAFLAAR